MPLKQLADIDFHPSLVRKAFWKIVPEVLFLPEWPFPKPMTVVVAQYPVESDFWERIAVSPAKNAGISIIIAQSLCLKKVVVLPRAAVSKAEAAVNLHIRQTMPANGRGLLWRSLPKVASGQSREYDIYVLKQSFVDELVARATAIGLRANSVSIESIEDDPLWSKSANNRSKRRFWLQAVGLLVLGSAILTVFNLERKNGQIGAEKSALVALIQDKQTKLVAAQDDAMKAKSEAASLAGDLSKFISDRQRLRELSDLTDILPDHVWVSELNIIDDRIFLAGFASGDVAEVMKVLRGVDWVASVNLDGPINFDSYNQQNRFQLTLQIRPSGSTK